MHKFYDILMTKFREGGWVKNEIGSRSVLLSRDRHLGI